METIGRKVPSPVSSVCVVGPASGDEGARPDNESRSSTDLECKLGYCY